VAAVYGITLAQGRIRERSGQISHSSPQLKTANENGNFVCPDSSQITRLFILIIYYFGPRASHNGKPPLSSIRLGWPHPSLTLCRLLRVVEVAPLHKYRRANAILAACQKTAWRIQGTTYLPNESQPLRQLPSQTRLTPQLLLAKGKCRVSPKHPSSSGGAHQRIFYSNPSRAFICQ